MPDTRAKAQRLTAEALAEEVWEDESPATGTPQAVSHDLWHPDVNELLAHSTSFEE
jgi:hypothetical protein